MFVTKPTEIPFHLTMSDANPEARMAYFREDIGNNSHHMHWHLVFPGFMDSPKLANSDRRGEIFYYMHHNMLN